MTRVTPRAIPTPSPAAAPLLSPFGVGTGIAVLDGAEPDEVGTDDVPEEVDDCGEAVCGCPTPMVVKYVRGGSEKTCSLKEQQLLFCGV